MRLVEVLLNEVMSNTNKLRFTQAEIDDAVTRIQTSTIFKELTKHIGFAPNKVRLKHGTLYFQGLTDQTIAKHVGTPIMVNAKGDIRGYSGKRAHKLTPSVALDDKDLYKSYEILLKNVLNYVLGANKRKENFDKRKNIDRDRGGELDELGKQLDGGFKDEASIRRWLILHGVARTKIDVTKDLVVNVRGDVGIGYNKRANFDHFDRCPIKFGRVDGNFDISYRGLKSLDNLPVCKGELNLGHNEIKLIDKHLECDNLILDNNPITTLHDIHKLVKANKISARLYEVKSSIIGLLYFKEVVVTTYKNVHFEILNRFIKEPVGHKRVFNCQCALQDADLDEYAHL